VLFCCSKNEPNTIYIQIGFVPFFVFVFEIENIQEYPTGDIEIDWIFGISNIFD